MRNSAACRRANGRVPVPTLAEKGSEFFFFSFHSLKMSGKIGNLTRRKTGPSPNGRSLVL